MERKTYLELAQPQPLNLTPPVKSKRAVKEVKTEELPLTPDQSKIFNSLTDWFINGENALAVLEGYAGVGKTYLTNVLVEQILAKNKKVLVTAPTNKAVGVLRSSAQYDDPANLSYSTIHSAFGLKEKKRYGKVTFERDYDSIDQTWAVDLVIIDESSMLPNQLWKYCIDSAANNNTLFLFVGDPAQLPPVNELISKPLSRQVQSNYDIPVFELTEIVRQKADSPVIEAATYLRNNLKNSNNKLDRNFNNQGNETEGARLFIENTAENAADIVANFFTSDQFKENANYAKVLCWTNKSVDAWNTFLRTFIFLDPYPEKIIVGEKLIADKPIVNVGISESDASMFGDMAIPKALNILYNTNDAFEVVKADIITMYLYGIQCKVYECLTKHINHFGEVEHKTIHVIHEDSESIYNQTRDNQQKVLAELQRSHDKPSDLGKRWKEWYVEDERLAKVKYDLAVTVHKSQGSTYQNVFVDTSNIDRLKDVYDRNRLKYTAITRTSDRLFVLYN